MEKAKKQLALIVMLTITLVSGTALAAAPTDGLIAHWKFDEASGTIAADSAGNNDATIYGAQWTQGVMAGALEFDGTNDYAETTTLDELGSVISVCAWINVEDISDHRSIFGRVQLSSRGYYAWQNCLRVMASSRVSFGDRTGTGQSLNVYSNTLLQLNRWYHIVATRDASNQIKIYIDGVLDKSESMATQSLPSVKYRIGRFNTGHYPFDGGIDDLRIYNRVLTDQEVQQVYNDAFAVLTGLEITGPDEIAEDTPVPYKAIAHYDNGSTADVTDLAEWAVEPNALADIEDGVLTAEKINKQYKELAIGALYTEGEITADAMMPVTVYAVCGTGSALEFDGSDDYVEISTMDELGSVISVCAWVNVGDMSDHRSIFGRDELSSRGYYAWQNCLRVMSSSRVSFGDRTGDGQSLNVYSNTQLQLNRWYHIAVTRDASNQIKIYIDGVLDNTESMATYSIPGVKYRIGRFNTGYYPFDGIIDDVKVYDRPLTAEEIQAMFESPTSDVSDGLVGYWDFDDGEGSVAYDLSGNGNDGTLVGDPVWVKPGAPVNICTVPEMVERNMTGVVDIKNQILNMLEKASVDEQATIEMLDEFFRSGDTGDLNKGGIAESKQKINTAMQHEDQAANAVNKSIEKINDAKKAVGLDEE